MATRTETFDSSSRYTLTPGAAQVIGGYACLLTPQTVGTAEFNEEYEVSAITSVSESVSTPGGTSVKYILRIDGTLYWWDGAAWSVSDGTISQANTTAEINTNKATIPFVGTGSALKVVVVMSGTVTASPKVYAFTTNYTLNFVDPVTPVTSQVHISLRDLLGSTFDPISGSFWVQSDAPASQGNALYVADTQRATLDTSGNATLTLANTEESGRKVVFYVSYIYRDRPQVIRFKSCVIRNVASINVLDLTEPTTEAA